VDHYRAAPERLSIGAMGSLSRREVDHSKGAAEALAAPDKPTIPVVHIPAPDLGIYDRLFVGGAA